MRLLERKDINPDQPGARCGLMPLTWAEGGHEGIVQMLLHRKDVNPDQTLNMVGHHFRGRPRRCMSR